METAGPEYRVVTTPEASKRGWVTTKSEALQLSGTEARQKALPLLKNLAQIYKTGGKSTLDYLEVSGLKLPKGGVLNLHLQNLCPEDIRTLDELFDLALGLAAQGPETEAQLVVATPLPECKLIGQIKK